ncbi:WhiB family transcriptional regulator [Streptomyces sp. NRRL S-241]|uniref:WhiB family transcriptional regulator n=1 Tax=Streptomyces sp. NRRL S-241 TaxID=1463896 RepID=UPI000689CC60|nr:WhiB family transcriptional regulator [Streptomyces sp. NRRL S-241]
MSPLVTNHRSRPHADTTPDGTWAARGACVGRLAEFEASEAAAKRICATCPVTTQCLDEALAQEGRSSQYYRDGVRGGRNEAERAALSSPTHQLPKPAPAKEADGPAEHAAALLRAGELGTSAIAAATGMCITSVKRLRRALGLPPAIPRPPTLLERFTARTTPGEDGHLLWVGKSGVSLGDGRVSNGVRLAFQLGYGRAPQGQVKSRCEVPGCVAWRHLSDRSMRGTPAKTPRRTVAIPQPAEYLYGIEPGHWEHESWVPDRVVRFPIIRRTPRRIYYIRQGDEEAAAIGDADRHQLETHGDVYLASRGQWEPDSRLYLAPPAIEEKQLSGMPQPPEDGADAAWIDAAAAAA